ncbi:MAG: SEL1-like repeat protein [Sedimentisphaerales bacterium]|nr:SEL1-like repeat protein [Sedimentisphaerales bacterium]
MLRRKLVFMLAACLLTTGLALSVQEAAKTTDANDSEAVKRYTKAAEQGEADAQFLLACMYREGEGVPQDYKEAVKWYMKAAEQENAAAQYLLGYMYREGKGVPQDCGEAVKWYTKAAEHGDAHSQNLLGDMYFEGQRVPQDYKEAVKWYTKAAEQGLARAQFRLGLMYWEGKGVLEDYTEAYKWVLLAGMNGDDTQSLKAVLRKEMTPSQIEEAQRRAKDLLDQQAQRRVKKLIAEIERRSKQGKQGPENAGSTATGFLIAPDGFILTACHAVEKAAKIEVLYNGRTYPAKLVLKDEAVDIAVLKIDGSGFASLTLVFSATVKTGDVVFTVGFPRVGMQGTEPKYTEGSISSLSGPGGNSRFFQISVPVQPGNSGGPLLDERGQVIGMVNARLNDLTTLATSGILPQNINYAVKSSFVLPFLDSIADLPTESKAEDEAGVDRSALIERTKQALAMVICY